VPQRTRSAKNGARLTVIMCRTADRMPHGENNMRSVKQNTGNGLKGRTGVEACHHMGVASADCLPSVSKGSTMLGILTMAGNALRSLGTISPVIKWGVVAVVGLLAVAFIAKEGTSIYVAMSTAPAQIDTMGDPNAPLANDDPRRETGKR
jgi:hypothetical protein